MDDFRREMPMLSVAVMPEKKKPRGRPKGTGPKGNVVALKGTPEWKTWLDEFADHCRLGLAGVIDLALERLAEDKGFRPPPKRF
jgi:hypothetical protein